MGHGYWRSSDWQDYAARSVNGRSRDELFGARGMNAAYDPAKITMRESCDSSDNPQATPIIIGVDVTGSMGVLAEQLVVHGLNATFTQLLEHKPVPDPHVMAMAIGDAYCDNAPLQATQFEADLRIVEQLRQLWLEGGGGGNDGESYSLAHVFAGLKTQHDAMLRRGRKGFLFTVGDEPVLDGVTQDQMWRVFGLDTRRGVSAKEAVRLASASYEVFHIIINGGYAARSMPRVRQSWDAILPGRVRVLNDPTGLADIIVDTITRVNAAPAQPATGLTALLPASMRRPNWFGMEGA